MTTLHFLAQTASDTALLPHKHGGGHKRALLLIVYGLFLIVGGVMGYVKAKSLPSLIAGGVSGVIAIVLAFFVLNPVTPYAALALSIILIGIMGKRYLDTKKAVPALLIIAFSLVVAILQVYLIASSLM